MEEEASTTNGAPSGGERPRLRVRPMSQYVTCSPITHDTLSVISGTFSPPELSPELPAPARAASPGSHGAAGSRGASPASSSRTVPASRDYNTPTRSRFSDYGSNMMLSHPDTPKPPASAMFHYITACTGEDTQGKATARASQKRLQEVERLMENWNRLDSAEKTLWYAAEEQDKHRYRAELEKMAANEKESLSVRKDARVVASKRTGEKKMWRY